MEIRKCLSCWGLLLWKYNTRAQFWSTVCYPTGAMRRLTTVAETSLLLQRRPGDGPCLSSRFQGWRHMLSYSMNGMFELRFLPLPNSDCIRGLSPADVRGGALSLPLTLISGFQVKCFHTLGQGILPEFCLTKNLQEPLNPVSSAGSRP